MTEKINADKKLLTRIKDAQLKWARDLCDVAATDGYGDDGYDDLRSGLDLARELVELEFEEDLKRFSELLNGDGEGETLESFSVGGICEAIWELHPPALAELQDD